MNPINFKGIQQIFKSKNKGLLAQLVYRNYLIHAQTKYWTKQDIEEAWQEDLEKFDWEIIEYGNKGEYNIYEFKKITQRRKEISMSKNKEKRL